MVAVRIAGGRYGIGAGRLTWQGATVKQQIDDGAQEVMNQLAGDILTWLHENLHRITHDMVNKSFAVVEVAGTKRTLRLGSESDHTLDHELGNPRYSGHPQFRQCADEFAPQISPRLRAYFASAGA